MDGMEADLASRHTVMLKSPNASGLPPHRLLVKGVIMVASIGIQVVAGVVSAFGTVESG
jgi:hypothetical protein